MSETLLIVGAGPAGWAATRAAVATNPALRVTLVDDNFEAGGQIWRGAPPTLPPGVELLRQTRVVDQPRPGVLRAESPTGILDLPYQKLLLATGARERFLPFPGWTLPRVLGAGGLQAMVKGGLPIAGQRVVVAGTGPLLLAVAAYLRQHGAIIAALCEQASVASLARFGVTLPLAKIAEGVRFARILRGVRSRVGTWPVAASLGPAGLNVVLNRGGAIVCDYLACGFHLVPNTELATLLGCATQNGFVVVNDRQETTVPGIYCAGEPTGIGGLELALAEGEIAGVTAAGGGRDAALEARRERYRRFAARLEAAFALRPELRALPRPETIVCRCEDVTFERIRAHANWRAAKLQTRCGMGPCQARICGPAAEFLLGWPATSLRPPIFPTPLAALLEPAAPPSLLAVLATLSPLQEGLPAIADLPPDAVEL